MSKPETTGPEAAETMLRVQEAHERVRYAQAQLQRESAEFREALLLALDYNGAPAVATALDVSNVRVYQVAREARSARDEGRA